MAKIEPTSLIIRPLMTERSTILKDKFNQYLFEVSPRATKGQIRDAVGELFKVNVERVRTMVVKGKLRRFGRHSGYKPDWKKAIVTLQKGQKIDLVEETT